MHIGICAAEVVACQGGQEHGAGGAFVRDAFQGVVGVDAAGEVQAVGVQQRLLVVFYAFDWCGWWWWLLWVEVTAAGPMTGRAGT